MLETSAPATPAAPAPAVSKSGKAAPAPASVPGTVLLNLSGGCSSIGSVCTVLCSAPFVLEIYLLVRCSASIPEEPADPVGFCQVGLLVFHDV